MLTLPTILTTLRAVLIAPLFACVLVAPPRAYLAGFLLLWLALLTDALDGYFATRLNQRTDFGALFDALTDKILIHVLLVAFLLRGAFPAWLVFAMFIRDMFTDGLRNYAAGRGTVIKAFIWGKLKFGFQFAALNAAFLSGLLGTTWPAVLAPALLAAALLVSLPGTITVIRACARAAQLPRAPKIEP